MQMLCLHVQAPEDNEDARLMFEGELRALSVEKKGNSYSRSVRLAIKFMLSIPWYWLGNIQCIAAAKGTNMPHSTPYYALTLVLWNTESYNNAESILKI